MMYMCMHAKSLQSCQTLCNPMDWSLPGSFCPCDSPGRNTGVGCHALLQLIFLTCPSPGNEQASLKSPALVGGFFTTGKCKKEKKKSNNWLLDEIVGWHHRLNRQEFEHTPGDGEGQGSLAYCSPWSRKEADTTEWLSNNNNTETHTSWCQITRVPITPLQLPAVWSWTRYPILRPSFSSMKTLKTVNT